MEGRTAFADGPCHTAPVTSEIRGRYAPSPTGRLHLGNARTALLAWLHIRALGGRFVLRIEDLDPGRSRPHFERWMLEDLRWLGLDWDEGPDVGGRYGPYRQSERAASYEAALARLDTYECTCTRREVRDASVAPHGMEPVYPGTCARGPQRPDRPRSIRWRVPHGEVRVLDAIAGELRQDVAREVGDFVLRRSDGAWAYQLAVVVDDADMRITDVLRGADLVDSTPRQVLLAHALGWSAPRYAHAPLVRGADGEKLSKRHGAPDLGRLREGGADPERVVAILAHSSGLVPPRVRRVHPTELVADFDPNALAPGPGDVLREHVLDWSALSA